MKREQNITIMLFVSLLLLSPESSFVVAQSHVEFIPGDAYFRGNLDSDSIDRKNKTITLQYRPPRRIFTDGFYQQMGYGRCVINSVPDDILQEIFNECCLDAGEQGAPSRDVFVYSSDYDFLNYGIGFKYNENWHKVSVELIPDEFKDKKALGSFIYHTRVYQPIFVDYDTAVMDWKYSERVAPCKLSTPPNDCLKWSSQPKQTAQGDWNDLSLAVIEAPYIEKHIEGPFPYRISIYKGNTVHSAKARKTQVLTLK